MSREKIKIIKKVLELFANQWLTIKMIGISIDFMNEEIKIIAVVQFNSKEAYVLNRRPNFEYIKHGSLLYAIDGPFSSVFFYDTPSPGFKAFAGRNFDLPLKKGGSIHCNGQWWDGGIDQLTEILGIEFVPITIGQIDELKKCYVYFGASGIKSKIIELRNQYKGPVYPYREYEKIITYDDMRKNFYYRERKLERRVNSLIKEVRKKHKLIAN